MEASPERFWLRRARLVAHHRNFATALAAFLPAAIVTAALVACALLVLRQRGPLPPAFWPLAAVAFLLAAAFAIYRARSRFFTTADAFVHLESHLLLHNRLSAAAAGVGDFPPPQSTSNGLTWRWQPIVTTLAACAAVLLLAAWIPISTDADSFRPTQTPTSWTETQTWAERLAEAEIVEPQAVQTLEDKLDALRDQPAEDWFSHASLEAGDSLRDQTAQSLRALERDLTTAASQLSAAGQLSANPSDPALRQLSEEFKESLAGLELGNLPLNPELLSDLKNLDLSRVRQLDPKQLAELQKRLNEGAQICEACLGPGEGGGEKLVDGLLLSPGSGGTARGPGTQPVGRKAQPTRLGGGVPQPISNDDLSRALPAETLGLTTGEHDDPTPTSGVTAGGTISSAGSGGDAVWRENLTPAERETLQRFFK